MTIIRRTGINDCIHQVLIIPKPLQRGTSTKYKNNKVTIQPSVINYMYVKYFLYCLTSYL
jgi:hypothetical protein